MISGIKHSCGNFLFAFFFGVFLSFRPFVISNMLLQFSRGKSLV